MLILAVDTSTQAGSLAILRGTRVVGEVSTWVEEAYSSRMFRQLDYLLSELRLALSNFELFAVAAGPGSFTGLRVGLTAVKGWAEIHGKPIAAVSGLEAIAAQAHSAGDWLAAVLDARRGQLYGGLYRREGPGLVQRGEEVVMPAMEFLEAVRARAGGAPVNFVSPTPEVLIPALAGTPYRQSLVEEVSTVLAPVIGRLGFERAGRGELVDALTLDANYIRRSDAELHWKGEG